MKESNQFFEFRVVQLHWGFWKINFSGPEKAQHRVSSNRPAPLIKRTHPEITIVPRTYQETAQVEQIAVSGMGTKEPLRLTD